MNNRLEEIKAKFRDSSDDDIAYLIQQAERVEELEEWREQYHERNMVLLKENKRYKQALEEIKTYCLEVGITSEEMLQMSGDIEDMVIKALEYEDE